MAWNRNDWDVSDNEWNKAIAARSIRKESDFQEFAGASLAKVVEMLFQAVVDVKLVPTHAEWSANNYSSSIDVDGYRRHVYEFWNSYRASDESVISRDGRANDILYDQYYVETFDDDCGNLAFWDWIPCRWLINAFRPLVKALEEGIVGVAGQREPVESPNQALEAVPYLALDNRLWRLHREKSRLEVLGANGLPEQAFRRAVLTLPGNSGQHVTTAAATPDPGTLANADVGRVEQIQEATRLIHDKWLSSIQSVGSKRIAREFRYDHPYYTLTEAELRKIADNIRSYPLKPGRPASMNPKSVPR